jgi:hypothetical protein
MARQRFLKFPPYLVDYLILSGRWLHSHSVRVRRYSVFALLFLLVIGLGIVGFVRLSDVNHASKVIRNHWLRDTRILCRR